MARAFNKLNDIGGRRAAEGGRHSDGGLYLNVSPSGSKSWLFIWVLAGKRREMGLGSYPAVCLARARKMASDCREAVAGGKDPIAERDKSASCR